MATLICLIMLTSFAAGAIVTVRGPVPEPIIMWAVVTTNPFFGFYGGYHDVLYLIQDELENIGVDLRIQMYDDFTWYDIVWDEKWNVSGDADGNPGTYTYGVDGWDFFVGDWTPWPTGYLWIDELVYSWNTPDVGGFNTMHWMNEEADELYDAALTTFDPAEHKTHMWDWQELFMHDPPIANMYHGYIYGGRAAYLEGFEISVWFQDLSELTVNVTKFNEVAPPSRKAIGPNTLVYGVVEPLWAWNPLFTLTYTEEQVRDMTHDTLYRVSREDLTGASGKYYTKPTIAADYPTWIDGPNGPNTVARVPIRQGITWTDGVPLNATDVAWSYNLVVDVMAKSYAYCDFAHILQEAVVVDEYTVDFICYAPRYDFTTIFSSDWGVQILPWHQLKDIDRRDFGSHASNFDPIPVSRGGEGLEGTGPYVVTSYTSDVQITLTKRTDYWGHEYGWGTELPDTFILKWVPDAADRLLALQSLEIDFGEYSIAPVETWENMMDWPTLNVRLDLADSSNPLWMNLDNKIISNRYVRQAIAHIIPYNLIYSEILPSWGIKTAFQGKTFITPLIETFHTELEPFEYNITVAQMYMNMWRYAQEDTDYTLGPVGDADFSGVVRLDDFITWATNFGTEPADWTFNPGNDIDPDFDNSGTVNLDDFIEWAANYGTYYPFEGAR